MTNKTKVLTPIKAIREKCLDCSGGSYREVRLCPVQNCALHPYRMGKRPTKVTLDTINDSNDEN